MQRGFYHFPMISIDEAISILTDKAVQSPFETVALNSALNRVTAKPVTALVTLPPYNVSAMDGYAVKFEEARKAGATLNVIGEIPAGQAFKGRLKTGDVVRLFTGSRLPLEAEHILIQENVTRDADKITINKSSPAPRHIRRAGIDFERGTTLIHKGMTLTPPQIALAAAGNHARLSVVRRPRVAIITSGDELVHPGTVDIDRKIINSNTPALSALIRHWGGDPFDAGLAGDDISDISACIAAARDADIILPVGGASAGDYDFMRRAFEKAGVQFLFHKIAIKPGKPTWFAKLGNTPVLGLPGNPASAIVCAHLFLKVLMNAPIAPTSMAKLGSPLPDNGPRETYIRGRAYMDDGSLIVLPFPRQDSSLLTPFAEANVLIKRASNVEASEAGYKVPIIALGTGPSLLELPHSN